MKLTRAVAAILALFLLPVAAQAQPRPPAGKYPRSMSTREIRDFIQNAQLPFTLTVCNSSVYGGDYKTLGAALAAVPTRFPTRGVNQRVTVLVYACDTTDGSTSGVHYEEATLSVPTWTTVQGISAPWHNGNDQTGRAVIQMTGTTGDLVTLGQGASLMNLYIKAKTGQAATGAVNLVKITSSSTSGLTNIQVVIPSTFIGFEVHAYDVTGSIAGIHLGASSSTANVTGLYFSGSGAGTLYGGVVSSAAGTGLVNAGSGTVRLFGTRFSSATALTDIVGTSGTTEIFGVDYLTESGTVTGKPVRTDSLVLSQATTVSAPAAGVIKIGTGLRFTTSASAPYTCDATATGDIYFDTTTPSPCWCSGSAWTPFVIAANCS